MRRLAVNFVQKRSWRVPLLWVALTAGVVIFVFQTRHLIELQDAVKDVGLRAHETAAQRARLVAPGAGKTLEVPGEMDLAAARLAGFDVGGVLKAAEALKLPGVRLVSLTVDAQEATVRLEVELGDVAQVSACLDLLNQAQPEGDWRYVDVQSANQGRLAMVSFEAWGLRATAKTDGHGP